MQSHKHRSMRPSLRISYSLNMSPPMPNYLHPNYVVDHSAYDACKAFWAELFAELAGAYPGAGFWKPGWEAPIVTGDGTVLDPIDQWREFGVVCPMLGRVSPDRMRAVIVLHLLGEEGDDGDPIQQSLIIEFKLEQIWWETQWTDGELEVLNIAVAPAEENLEGLKSALSRWIDPATSYSDMDEFLRDIEASQK